MSDKLLNSNKNTSGLASARDSGSHDKSGASKNIKVNDDGTISPIDPSKPSVYSSDFSEKGVVEAILLNMEWCHAVKTESLEKATKSILTLIEEREREARINELECALPSTDRDSAAQNYIEYRIKKLSYLSKGRDS